MATCPHWFCRGTKLMRVIDQGLIGVKACSVRWNPSYRGTVWVARNLEEKQIPLLC